MKYNDKNNSPVKLRMYKLLLTESFQDSCFMDHFEIKTNVSHMKYSFWGCETADNRSQVDGLRRLTTLSFLESKKFWEVEVFGSCLIFSGLYHLKWTTTTGLRQ